MAPDKQEGTPQSPIASVYDWEGELVFLSYVGGPEVGELTDAFGIVRGSVEAKLGVFLLQEVSSLGVMVKRPIRDNDKRIKLGTAFFVPWTAIQMIDLLTEPDDSESREDT